MDPTCLSNKRESIPTPALNKLAPTIKKFPQSAEMMEKSKSTYLQKEILKINKIK